MLHEPRILLADDDAVSRQLVARMLQKLGFTQVTAVEDGFEAWQKIQLSLEHREPYALVLTDWRMPRYDGMRLLTSIRAHESTSTMKVIMLTGKHERAEVQKALSHQVTDYIVKPVTLDTLAAKLKKALGSAFPRADALKATGTDSP